MGVFRTKSVTENVEQYRETGEREGEAQNTTFLNVSFRVSSVPDFLDDGSRQFRIHPKMPACGAENKIGNFTQLSLDTKKYRTRGT